MELPIIATKEAKPHHSPCGVSRAHNLQPPPLPALKLQTTVCDLYNVTVPNSRNYRLLSVISPLPRCLLHIMEISIQTCLLKSAQYIKSSRRTNTESGIFAPLRFKQF